MDLNDYRKEIDQIDDELIALFAKRMETAEKIAAYKGVETSVRSIGESWELSGVAGHESIVAEGPCKGVSLPELIDRYGEPPASTLALLDVAMLRGEACAAGIRDISQRGDTITFTFGGEMPVEAVMRVCAMGKNKRRLTLSAGIEPKLALRLEGGEKPLPAALELVESIAPAEGA